MICAKRRFKYILITKVKIVNIYAMIQKHIHKGSTIIYLSIII